MKLPGRLLGNSVLLCTCIYDVILFAHVHSQIVAAASIRGRRLFRSAPQIVRCLFEGGVYSRAVSIRGNTVCSYTENAGGYVENSSSHGRG